MHGLRVDQQNWRRQDGRKRLTKAQPIPTPHQSILGSTVYSVEANEPNENVIFPQVLAQKHLRYPQATSTIIISAEQPQQQYPLLSSHPPTNYFFQHTRSSIFAL